VCNLYSHTKGPKAIREIANAMGGDWLDSAGNLEPQPGIFPDGVAPVVRATPSGGRELLKMRWGFPSPPQAKSKYTTNVRKTTSNFWKPWLKPEYRCLVPVTSFCEYDWSSGKAVPTWFALDESRPLFFFAGIWRPWTGERGTKKEPATGDHQVFAFLTTEPNAEVAPMHEKAMPVCLLDREARETWLYGSVEEALALQGPSPDGTLHVVATGSRGDG
jgi:putative SOS response-associated peptidase YedK